MTQYKAYIKCETHLHADYHLKNVFFFYFIKNDTLGSMYVRTLYIMDVRTLYIVLLIHKRINIIE